MTFYTVRFSTVRKSSVFKNGVFERDVTEFIPQVLTGLPLRTAMQYDTLPDFKIVAEVPASERRGKPPRTPSRVSWSGGNAGTRTLPGEGPGRKPKKAISETVDRKLEAAATGDLGAAISEAA